MDQMSVEIQEFYIDYSRNLPIIIFWDESQLWKYDRKTCIPFCAVFTICCWILKDPRLHGGLKCFIFYVWSTHEQKHLALIPSLYLTLGTLVEGLGFLSMLESCTGFRKSVERLSLHLRCDLDFQSWLHWLNCLCVQRKSGCMWKGVCVVTDEL